MALLGRAALAMWWDMAPAMRAEFEHWHSVEHFPERLALPGFRRASRWADADGGPGFFILYELEELANLASPEYLARLNAPTPWSTRLMPHHARMVRCQSEVLQTRGAATARHMLTLRWDSPQPDAAAFAQQCAATQGVTGVHVLHHRPPDVGQTQEQRLRGGADAVADTIVLVGGYDAGVLRDLAAQAPAGAVTGLFSLSLARTRDDVALD